MTTTLPTRRTMTVEQFEAYALLPENADRRLEWHDGEVIELTSSSLSSRIGLKLARYLGNFVEEHGLGGCILNGWRCMPDGAYVSYARQPNPPDVAWNPIAPDSAIEVVSPTDRPAVPPEDAS